MTGSRTQRESPSMRVAAVTWDRIRSEVALRLRRGQRGKAEDLAAAAARALADVARAHGLDPASSGRSAGQSVGQSVGQAREGRARGGVFGEFFRGSSSEGRG